MAIDLPAKDPSDVEPYFVVWCSKDGVNTGAATDTGELQGATISTSTWTVPTGITQNSANTSAVTIKGVAYAISTVATIWLSGGTAGSSYDLLNVITTSDGRTLSQTITIRVENK